MKKFKLFKALMLMVSIMLISPQVWGQTWSVTNAATTTSSTVGGITYTTNGTASSGNMGGVTSASFMALGSGKYMQYVSGTANISRIEIMAVANATSAKKCLSILTSSNGSTFAAPTTYSATKNGSSLASVTDINLNKKSESWATVVVNFNGNATLPKAVKIARGSNNMAVYSVKIYTAPTAFTASSITSSGATFNVTDGANTNNYDFYYSTDSDAPAANTSATASVASAKTKAITGLEAGTRYYAWVRSTWSSGAVKGDWRAMTGTNAYFETESGGPATYTVSATANPAGYGTVSPTSISSIASETSITTSSNVLTVGASTITATATTQTSQYSYAFSNWTKSDGTALPSTVTADLAVLANFTRTERSYTVTHSLSGVTTSSGTTATYGTDYMATFAASSGYTLPSTITVMRGSTNITANCTWVQATGSLTIPGAQNTGNITVTITGGEITTCTVTYDGSDATGGDVPTDSNSPYTSGSTVTVLGNSGKLTKAFEPEPSELVPATFIGWNTNSNTYSGTHYNEDDQFTISGNTTLYAVWGYPIDYDADGGTINDASYPSYYICTYPDDDATTTLPSNVTKDGYTFVGWKTENGSGTIITEITGDYTGAFSGDHKLKAIWSEVGYSVTYAANGGSGSVPTDANTYSPNAEVTVLGKNTLSKSGYTFVGWSDGTTLFLEGQTFTISNNVTLTAVWKGTVAGEEFYYSYYVSTPLTTNYDKTKLISKTTSSYLTMSNHTQISDGTSTRSTDNATGVVDGTTYNFKSSPKYIKIASNGYFSFTTAKTSTVKIQFITCSNDQSGIELRASSSTGTLKGSLEVTSKQYKFQTLTVSDLPAGTYYVVGTASKEMDLGEILVSYAGSPTGCKVTFNKGSGPSTVTGMPSNIEGITSGLYILEPEDDPEAENYIFDGWVTTSGGSTPFDFANTTITADKTIYAKWVAKASPGSGTVSGTANICPGSNTNVTLSTSVSGASYQLYKDNVASGDPKPGTGSALNWSVSAAGTYTVKAVETATHASGNMSGSATISIYTALSKTSDPTSSKSATVGVGCALDGLAYTGNANVACQWQSCTDATPTSTTNISDGGAYSNCTTSAMTFTPASTGTYYFRCVVSDDCGSSFNTGVVTVTAKIAPNVYSLSGEPTALCGGTATLTLSGSQSGLNYQLYKGGVAEGDSKSGTGNTLTWTGIDAAGTYTVKTVETSTYAEAPMSGSVTISIMTPTSISTQPTTSVTVHDGVSFTLGSNLVGAGEGTLTYQWYSYTGSGGAGEATVGSATTTKTLTTSKSAGTYYYKVEVIGECGSVKSNMITVTVDNKHLLSFSANSGSGSVPGSAYYAPSASVTLNSTTIPTRSGYVFLGWNTNSSGTGDMYQPGATYTMPATATTLYAAWGSPCFSFSKGTKDTEPTDGFVMTPENINSSAFKSGATLSGGTLTNTSGATLGINASNGFVMVKSTRELTLTLTGGQFQAGTVIALEGYTNSNSTVHTYGFSVSGNAATPLKTATASSYDAYKQRYVVTVGDGIEGTSSCTVTMNASASGSQTYLSAIYIGGCMSCTTITPSLNYGTTNLYLLGGANTASPTITGNTGSGAVTYSSSNTSAVDVNASTGVITAVAPGTATITARIASSGDYCGGIASVEITVLSLVQQTVNLNAAWSTVPNMTFPGDPTSTLTRNANIAATGYSIDESNNKSGLTSRIYGIPSSTSKNDSYYMSFSFKTPDYGVRLTSVVVPIQPITNTASAIVTVSDGTTTLTSNEEADIPNGAKKTCTFAITPTVFAAGKTITVKIFVYDQTGDKGFRFGSPILVNGSVITSGFTFTGEGANANWSTTANWNWGILPTINNDVVVEQPVVVDVAHATAKSVVLNQSSSNEGSIDIPATGALVIAQTLKKTTDGETKVATEATDVYIHSTSSGTGALVIGSHDGTNQATVEFYSLGRKNNEGKKVYQYIGTPFNDVADAQYNYYGSWMYRWNAGSYSWTKMSNGMPVVAFMGYSIAQPSTDPRTYWMQGTLVSSANVAKDLVRHEVDGKPYENMFANSWMAPINLAAMDEDDFGGADATIYIFNTGSDADNTAGGGGWGSSAGQTTAVAGQYTTAPIKTSGWMAVEGNLLTVIPSMQAFSVAAPNEGDATLTLNYSKHVLTPALTSVSIQPNRAPGRRNAASSRPPMLRLFVNGESFGDQLWMFMRNDFSLGFDNGYDGRKLVGDSKAPQLYATTPDGNMAIHCTPAVDGTILGFKPGQDASYTFSFIYDGDETLYLNDLKTENSTLIREGNTYNFTYEDGDAVNRFMISATPFAKTTPTGIEDADWNGTGVQKVIYKDHMYIIRGGRMFDATGAMVK